MLDLREGNKRAAFAERADGGTFQSFGGFDQDGGEVGGGLEMLRNRQSSVNLISHIR